MQQFFGGPRIRAYTFTARSQVQSLVRELRSLKWCITTDNNNIKKQKQTNKKTVSIWIRRVINIQVNDLKTASVPTVVTMSVLCIL